MQVPRDIFVNILSHLSYTDLQRTCLVSQLWSAASIDAKIQKEKKFQELIAFGKVDKAFESRHLVCDAFLGKMSRLEMDNDRMQSARQIANMRPSIWGKIEAHTYISSAFLSGRKGY